MFPFQRIEEPLRFWTMCAQRINNLSQMFLYERY